MPAYLSTLCVCVICLPFVYGSHILITIEFNTYCKFSNHIVIHSWCRLCTSAISAGQCYIGCGYISRTWIGYCYCHNLSSAVNYCRSSGSVANPGQCSSSVDLRAQCKYRRCVAGNSSNSDRVQIVGWSAYIINLLTEHIHSVGCPFSTKGNLRSNGVS